MLVEGNVKHKILQTLQVNSVPLDLDNLHALLNVAGIAVTIRELDEEHLPLLEGRGMVTAEVTETDDSTPTLFKLAEPGVVALQVLEAARTAPPPPPTSVATGVQVGRFKPGNYYCPELGRTAARPGAYDAFDKPSIINGKHHYRTRQV